MSPQKARGAIFVDLSTLHRERRLRFGLSAVVVAALVGVMVTAMLRHDLLMQPLPPLLAQISLWVLGLVVLPAVGVGLWFPSRNVSIGLASSTIAVASVATLWPVPSHTPTPVGGLEPMCLMAAGMVGMIVLAATLLSGAFVQCQRASTKAWLAGGVAVLSLVGPVWMCSAPGVVHMLTSHIGAALGVAIVAALVGSRVRRASTTG